MDVDHLTLAQGCGAIITIGAVLAVVGGWLKVIRPRWKKFSKKAVAALDSIVGRDEVRDSITDELKIPALPGIGVRMAAVEHSNEITAIAIQKLVDQQEHLIKMGKRVDEHEDRITKLETNQVERVVARAETTAAYRAIETAIKATPDIESDSPEDE